MAMRREKGDGTRGETPQPFRAALLRNPARREIRQLLEQTPGLNPHQIADALDMHQNAVDFHVGRLADANLLALRPGCDERERLCFTPDNVNLWDDPATRMLFGRGPPRRVALYLAEHPGTNARELADALGLSVPTVRRHIRTLESCDLVQRLHVDRRVIYHAEPRLTTWVETVWDGARSMLDADA